MTALRSRPRRHGRRHLLVVLLVPALAACGGFDDRFTITELGEQPALEAPQDGKRVTPDEFVKSFCQNLAPKLEGIERTFTTYGESIADYLATEDSAEESDRRAFRDAQAQVLDGLNDFVGAIGDALKRSGQPDSEQGREFVRQMSIMIPEYAAASAAARADLLAIPVEDQESFDSGFEVWGDADHYDDLDGVDIEDFPEIDAAFEAETACRELDGDGTDSSDSSDSPSTDSAPESPLDLFLGSTDQDGPAADDTDDEAEGDSAPPASSLTGTQMFTSPSGNIRCEVNATHARCDIAEHPGWSAPPIPSDCITDWGNSLVVQGDRPGEFGCNGDAIYGEDQEALEFGDSIRVGDVECRSDSEGIRCSNTSTGHGFAVGKTKYELF